MHHVAFSGVALLAACGASSGAQTATNAPPRERPELLDLATDFLNTACASPNGQEFGSAWLAHEDRHRDFYEAVYYKDEEARTERTSLAHELGLRRDEMCGHTRIFLAAAPPVLQAQRDRVTTLVGSEPRSPVAFSAALQWTDGCVRDYQGKSYLILNARHDTFARTTGLVVTLAHELIHDAQSAVVGDRDGQLPPAARTLYREGAAVFGVQVLFPEIRDRATGLKPDQLEQAARLAPQAAADLLQLIRDRSPDEKARRFFQGGFQDPVYPPKMGYFLGAYVFQKIAEARGNQAAVRISPEAFGPEAEQILTALAGSAVTRGKALLAPAPAGDHAALERMRDRFIDRAGRTGLRLPFRPAIREWTRPSLISWRQEARAVAVPRWDELNKGQRTALEQIAGSATAAPVVFEWLFRWFFVPHELTHAFQTKLSSKDDHAASERLANDMAVAFFMEEPDGPAHLDQLAAIIESAIPRLAALPPDGDAYFNAHYDELGSDPRLYGSFQLRFVLDSLNRRQTLRFDDLAARLRGGSR